MAVLSNLEENCFWKFFDIELQDGTTSKKTTAVQNTI